MWKPIGAVSAAVLTFWFVVAPAVAHVTVQPEEAVVGTFSRFVVRVPNERDDASTTAVQVQLPPLAFVSFEDAPGWERTVEMTTLDEPLEVLGEQVTEVVGTVTWQGGAIGPGEFAEFGFSARMPDEPGALEFPAVQTYDSGEVVRWIGPPDSEEPAALVDVVDLGAEEGQGQLAVLAELNSGSHTEETASAPDDDDDGSSTLALVLGALGAGLGAIALIVSLTRRRA
jgi:periplasmic copper chaperone A